MAAYLIATIEVTDPAGLEAYRSKVGPVVERYGGQYLAAGPPEVKEGAVPSQVAAVIAFPDMARLHAFYDAPEYQELKALRQRSTTGSLLFLDGFPAQ